MKSKEILKDLRGTVCSGCEKEKHSMNSFCYRCYRELPSYLKQPLYKLMGQGYEEAFEKALSYLKGQPKNEKAA